MILFIFSFLFLDKVFEATFVDLNVEELENMPVSLFSGKLFLDMPSELVVSDIHGRFLTDSQNYYDFHDSVFLQDCADLNYSLVSEEIKINQNNKIKKFMKKLKAFISKSGSDPHKINTTLLHLQCMNALASCKVTDYGISFFKTLLTDYTMVFKEHLALLHGLDNFSFLTVELADVLFSERNVVTRPFALDRLIETVSVEVMVHLLEMWNYDLRFIDIPTVLNVWTSNEQFNDLIEKDPRSWLLWKKIGAFKPFSMDLLIEKLTPQNIDLYSNLILAWIIESESIISGSFGHLEFLYADFHKNDPFEETYMTLEMAEALDSRKWDLWHEAGKADIEAISEQMKQKKRLIALFEEFKKERVSIKGGLSSEQVTLYELSILLVIPLNPLFRESFNRSRDINVVISSMSKVEYSAPFYTPFVRMELLNNLDFWTVLWKQLEIFEIESAYDSGVASKYTKIYDIMLIVLYNVRRRRSQRNQSNYWHTEIALVSLPPMGGDFKNSEMFMKILTEMIGYYPSEFSHLQLRHLQSALHPEVVSTYFYRFQSYSFPVESFLLAPEILSRDCILELIRSEKMKQLISSKYENVMNLRTLADFSLNDLMEFFPIGANYHLELHKALYTVSPKVLVDFIKTRQGAINHPEKLVWWVHPRCWNEASFADVVAELIPFETLITHPRDAEVLNLNFIITDIVGRLNRRGSSSDSPQKMILKWIVHNEWMYFQYFNAFTIDREKSDRLIAKPFNEMSIVATRARAHLITWLKSNANLEDCDMLLRLIERIPVSQLRASDNFEGFLVSTISIFKPDRNRKPKSSDPVVYNLFTEKKAYQYTMQYIEVAVRLAIENCHTMIEKYFDGQIERQIWSNRLKIVNIPTIQKYSTHPIPKELTKNLFQKHAAPMSDLQVTFAMLIRHGYDYTLCKTFEGEYLLAHPKYAEMNAKNVKEYEDYIADLRKLIIEHELKKALLQK